MKKLTLIGIIFSGLLLSGCQLTHIEGEVDGVNIKASTNDKKHHGNGSFCPPGQAKKGNC